LNALDVLIQSADRVSDDLTVRSAIEMYEAARSADWSPSTRKSHAWHAAPVIEAFGSVPLADLRGSDISDVYVAWRSSGKAPGTIRRRHSLFAAALHHSVRSGWILRSPAEDVVLPKVKRNLMDLPSYQSIETALDRIPESHRRLQAVARLALASGARRGELAGLRWTDVDFSARCIRIHAAIAEGPDGVLTRKQTKTGSVRIVDVDADAMTDLRRWKSDSAARALALGVGLPDSAPVFGSPTDPFLHIKPSRISQDWSRCQDAIGLDDVRFHDLRHRYATTLLEEGVPIHHVSQRLGHSTPTITLITYAHAIPSGDRAGAAATSAARRAR